MHMFLLSNVWTMMTMDLHANLLLSELCIRANVCWYTDSQTENSYWQSTIPLYTHAVVMVTVRCWLFECQRTSRPVSNPRTTAGSLIQPGYFTKIRLFLVVVGGGGWQEVAAVLQRSALMRQSRQTSRLFSVDLWFKSRLDDWLGPDPNFSLTSLIPIKFWNVYLN
jgi:hypothetical protein